jgi:hypothetical protein
VAQTFSRLLTGANCTLGGQPIISLSATEDLNADYDTASVVCLAPGGAHAKGSAVQSIEGGVSTGWWTVEDPVRIRSGARTWRRKVGESVYRHLPLVSYRLRRQGYLAARSTLSAANIGTDNFPPKFCTLVRLGAITAEINERWLRGEIHAYEAQTLRQSWHPVYSATDVVSTICSWVGIPVQFRVGLPVMPDEYTPIGKPVIAALREVASWSGASVFLDRSGTLVVYDWQETYSRGGQIPMPAAVLEEELHDTIYPVTHVTVVGSGYAGDYRQQRAVEVTESLARSAAERPVEERIEIREYPINPALAQKIARERLSRVALEAGIGRWRGPAEGSQSIRPLANRVFSVTRTLEWDGTKYRYEIELTAPQAAIGWGAALPATGWW